MKLTAPTDALLDRLSERAAPDPRPAPPREQPPRDRKPSVKKREEHALH